MYVFTSSIIGLYSFISDGNKSLYVPHRAPRLVPWRMRQRRVTKLSSSIPTTRKILSRSRVGCVDVKPSVQCADLRFDPLLDEMSVRVDIDLKTNPIKFVSQDVFP